MSTSHVGSDVTGPSTAPGIVRRRETASEYVGRILGYLADRDPWAVLESTAQRLRAYVRATPIATLGRAPAPDRWSPARIITHLADAEIVVSYRLRLILAHDGVAVQAFDQDEWAETLAYDAADLERQVELFAAARAANLDLLRRVDPKLHENHGMHSERGRETVSHLVRLYAGHDLNHLGQLERMLG